MAKTQGLFTAAELKRIVKVVKATGVSVRIRYSNGVLVEIGDTANASPPALNDNSPNEWDVVLER
jgi:hypothetical protein